jgi:phosphonopyruvate decarboxylase
MIEPRDFLVHLRSSGFCFFSGVPDSLLGGLCDAICEQILPANHIAAANEGIAVGLAIGHYLANGTPPVVYLQNAGLGNIVNPLVSLAAREIYAIPMLLIIGWRGEIYDADGRATQIPDEPQHAVQGRITLPLLDLLDIAYEVIDGNRTDWKEIVDRLAQQQRIRKAPVALVVRKNTFRKPAASRANTCGQPKIGREEAIACCLRILPETVPIVATTGMASRELFELREQLEQGHHRDFLSIGGMGLASQVATGLASAMPDRKVVCIDGDGAMLMHMGGLATCARASNLIHLVMNNEAHDSVGGYPTAGIGLDLSSIAKSCGYSAIARATTIAGIEDALKRALAATGSAFIEVRCRVGHRPNLGRPTESPSKNREALMAFLTTSRAKRSVHEVIQCEAPADSPKAPEAALMPTLDREGGLEPALLNELARLSED